MKKLFRLPISVYSGILITFLSLTGAGCGVWRNFTTYFNLYYNLSDLYSQAEAAMVDPKRNIFDLEEIPISGNASALFNQVIEKSSKLLQWNAESAFVDDALLMLGKSFYYMQNYQKALRKFDELVIGQPGSSLVLEAEFWGAKTQLRLRNFEDGLKRLKAVKEKALTADDGNVLTLIYIEEIKYQLANKNYINAIDLCKALVKYDYDSKVSAETCFQMGKLYLLVNQYTEAVQAFKNVSNFSPSYELVFNSNVELGKALRLINENEAALKVFQKLRSESKYSDKYDVVDLEIGVSQMNLGNYKQAMTKLRVVDTTNSATMSAGIARFYIGKILEENYQLYDSAAGFYRKAASSAAPPEFQAKAQSKVAVFTKYNTLNDQIKDYNKQLSYLNDSTLYTKDSIKFAQDTAKLNKEALEKALETASNRRGTRDMGRGEDNTSNLPVQPNQNLMQNLKPPVYPKISVDSLNGTLAKAKYDLGGVYFTELNQIDSAVVLYKDILENYPKSKFKAQALFALGNCYETQNKKETADSIFNDIYNEYKTEPVVNSAAIKLNKPQIDLNFDPGKNLFNDAEKLMLKEQYTASIINFYDIFKKHPNSTFAPKALLASGWILENKLKLYDSAAVMYDSVISKYPQSQYAASVKNKMDVYKLDREKKKSKLGVRDSIAIASDSLKALKKDLAVKTDSTAAGTKDIAANTAAVKQPDTESKTAETVPAEKQEKKETKPTGKVTVRDINEMQKLSDKIAELEKQVADLKSEKNKILEQASTSDQRLLDALRVLLETKANLEKLPK